MSESVPDGWKSFKLGDVAEEISDRVDDPSKAGYDRFVGLDHLDSGELTIRRWGSTADLLSAMKLFKSGDILIGRRNAYLKRASKAEFDGVCSGDAYVVREKSGTIAEGLLPIILNSNSFWDYTIAHASGTMSKRAKWRDLAEYSFLLPSMDEQRRIATTLWAAEDCIVKGERFVTAAERAKQVLMLELFSKGIGHTEFKEIKWIGKVPVAWKIQKVKDFASVIRGASPRPKGDLRYYNGSVPRLMTEDVTRDGKWVHARIDSLTEEGAKLSRFLREGSLVIICSGGKDSVGLPGLLSHDACIHDGFLALQNIIKESSNPEFLYYWFLYYQKTMEQIATHGCAFINLTTDIISDLTVTLPPLPEQHQIVAILTRCDETIAAARANVVAAKAMKMKMINEMLVPTG
ncbi:MAG: restriction endonuclease subunit S [Methanoregula sp.]|uniref:restriction endonuclease subunit S n=1 Tax=Methanoregula sp. TaxID=2052170 RepID=UPI003C7772F9